MSQVYNVLFLCTGNSARSILAEAILKQIGNGRFRSYSAGSQPKGQVNAHAIQLLDELGYDLTALRSKSWDEFAELGSPEFDFVITVCDNAAGETCPLWPGHPITAHWGVPDPAAATGTDADIAFAFRESYRMLHRRIELFTALPLASLDQISLRSKLREIGRIEGATEKAKQG
jgi:arsenate reductase